MKNLFLVMMLCALTLNSNAGDSGPGNSSIDQLEKASQNVQKVISILEEVEEGVDLGEFAGDFSMAIRTLLKTKKTQDDYIVHVKNLNSDENLIDEIYQIQKIIQSFLTSKNEIRNENNLKVGMDAKKLSQMFGSRFPFLKVSGNIVVSNGSVLERSRYVEELAGEFVAKLLKIENRKDPRVEHLGEWAVTTTIRYKHRSLDSIISMSDYISFR